MAMALVFIVLVVLYLTWTYIKPSIANIGAAAEHTTEALAKGAMVLNAKAGEDLDDELLAKLEAQRKFIRK